MEPNSLSSVATQPEDLLDIDIEQFRGNNFITLLEADLNDNLRQLKATLPAGLLEVKTANNWIEQASKRPIPRMLFSEFWYEQELCILFADTNVGKTILAVQIADSISCGRSIPGFKLETMAQKVIYCDFELNDKQFQVGTPTIMENLMFSATTFSGWRSTRMLSFLRMLLSSFPSATR